MIFTFFLFISFLPHIRSEIHYYSTETDDHHDHSRAAEYSVLIGVVILLIYVIFRCNEPESSLGQPTISELSTIATGEVQPPEGERSLDDHTTTIIKSYPKTDLGESLELPEPDNKTCPICLCDYRAKEMLRTVPECNHYFHANCLENWLEKKPSCPICRNLPKSSVMLASQSNFQTELTYHDM